MNIPCLWEGLRSRTDHLSDDQEGARNRGPGESLPIRAVLENGVMSELTTILSRPHDSPKNESWTDGGEEQAVAAPGSLGAFPLDLGTG